MNLSVFFTVPGPFLDEVEQLPWQSWTPDFFNAVPGDRNIIMVTATEEELSNNLAAYPQVLILEKHQLNGLRSGLTLTFDENDDPVIGGSHDYNPDPVTLELALPDKATGPRALIDDDVIRLFGWNKRDYVN